MSRHDPQGYGGFCAFFAARRTESAYGLVCAGLPLLAALLLAATPVLRLSFQGIREGLAEGGRSAAGRMWQRVGANLVVVELAVAVVLLAGAGLLGQSFYRLLHVETGFDTTHLATVQVMAPENIYKKDAQKLALFREVQRRLALLPGVESVGLTSDLPVQCNCDTDWIRIVGKPFHGEHNEVDERDVSPAIWRHSGPRWCAAECLPRTMMHRNRRRLSSTRRWLGVFSGRRSDWQEDREWEP